MQNLEKILEEIEQKKERCLNIVKIEVEPMEITTHRERYKGLCMAEEIIRKHMNDDWIPVEERLPEKFSIGVEVTTKDLERNIARYAKPPMDMWISVYTGRTLDVIAWKEPSESYHPEEIETRKELERSEGQ